MAGKLEALTIAVGLTFVSCVGKSETDSVAPDGGEVSATGPGTGGSPMADTCDDGGASDAGCGGASPRPNCAIRKDGSGRVEEDSRRIVAVPWSLGAIDAPAVTELIGQVEDADVPVIAGAVRTGVEWDFRNRFRAALFGQDDERDGCTMTTE